jgi:hypothetical protein
MSTYGTMIDRIAAELERSDLGSAGSPGVIGTHINDAIRQYKARSWWFLQEPTSTAKTSTTTASNSYVSLISGIIQIDTLQITISGQLQRLTPTSHDLMESLHEGASSESQPWRWTQYGARVRLYPTPDDTYTLTWTGLFEDAVTLADSADTNDWMTHGELLIRHTARMTILRDYLRDDAGAQACISGITAASDALDREHMRRMPTRTIKARM